MNKNELKQAAYDWLNEKSRIGEHALLCEFIDEVLPTPNAAGLDDILKHMRDEFVVTLGDADCFDAYATAIKASLQSGGCESAIIETAIDRMGWDEINAFYEETRRGQSIYEDAGGYMLRCIKRLFGLPPQDDVVTYQKAARAMFRTQPPATAEEE